MNLPNIRAEVLAGNIVVYKTSCKCTAMASDQCHEQDNGGAKVVGLTENPSTLRRYTVTGSQVARWVAKCEEDGVA